MNGTFVGLFITFMIVGGMIVPTLIIMMEMWGFMEIDQ